jgi:hypothetical protein
MKSPQANIIRPEPAVTHDYMLRFHKTLFLSIPN